MYSGVLSTMYFLYISPPHYPSSSFLRRLPPLSFACCPFFLFLSLSYPPSFSTFLFLTSSLPPLPSSSLPLPFSLPFPVLPSLCLPLFRYTSLSLYHPPPPHAPFLFFLPFSTLILSFSPSSIPSLTLPSYFSFLHHPLQSPFSPPPVFHFPFFVF